MISPRLFLPFACCTSFLCFVPVTSVAEQISTAVGSGADVEMRERIDGGFTEGAFNTPSMNTRTSGGGDRNEIIGLKFDLSGYSLPDLTNVTLNLIAYRTDNNTRVVRLYGVSQGTFGGTGNFDTETWSDANLTFFGDLPGLEASDGNPATQNLNTGSLTPLGEQTIPGDSVQVGESISFGDSAITDYVQSYSGSQLMTFLLAAGNTSSGQFRIASKEADALDPTTVNGNPGDFAPYLEFGVLVPPPPGVLLITNATLVDESLVLSGAGGPNSASFVVLASPDITMPVTNWPTIATNHFDSSGGFVVTNPIASGVPERFFRLRILNPSELTPPAILVDPEPDEVLVGGTAMFSVTAIGDAPLSYQWLFNTNSVLPGENSSMLTLNDVQAGQAGGYSVRVSNPAGAVTSMVAQLTVNVPAFITAAPGSLVVTEGDMASFSVGAEGTDPLAYQWYFNNTNAIMNATNSTFTISSTITGNTGGYRVVVTNLFGAATSQVATLTVTPDGGTSDFSLIGFAALGGGVTGGSGGATQTVTTASAFRSAVESVGPLVVQVSGMINLAGSANVRANKTIVGLGQTANIIGTLNISGSTVSNVMVRNLTISTPAGDGITIINGAHHIWVDHCTFFDCSDGQLDITQQADFVTVSWCKFNYTSNSGHNFSMLIGSSDGVVADRGKLNVTLHHNWWSTLAIERMPRVRYGDVHSFNNYFNAPGNNYCIRAAIESEVLIENNYFQAVDEPWTLFVTTGTNGMMRAVGNVLVNCTSTNTPAIDNVFIPPYAYTLELANSVPGAVTNHAGVGRGPFAP